MPALIWTNLQQEGLMPICIAITSDTLYHQSPFKHPIDQIRNDSSKRISYKQAARWHPMNQIQNTDSERIGHK
jgi:hypothetical protein